jgi:hypothetical protein
MKGYDNPLLASALFLFADFGNDESGGFHEYFVLDSNSTYYCIGGAPFRLRYRILAAATF